MHNNKNIDPIVFILGSGFNVDVSSEAGVQGTLPVSGLPARYPVVRDLLNICFNLDELPLKKSIEDLFQKSIDEGDEKPIGILYDYLMELDYYIVHPITPHINRGGKHYNNAYIRFLRDFQESPLITFNYDSVLEILLCSEGLWSPRDGFGISVQAQEKTIRKGPPPIRKSQRSIFHLHGSLCVYTSTYYFNKQQGHEYPIYQEYDEPKFIFDPLQLGKCFYPFERIPPSIDYTPIVDRVIAPIPDKAEGLKGEFITAMYKKTINLLNIAKQIVVIGYSFNRNDNVSYVKLLAAAVGKPVLLISPDAEKIIVNLRSEYTNIRWMHKSMYFKDWVKEGYPGIQK